MKLMNKNIVITGATSGIGLQLLDMLYANNTVYIIARDKNKINDLQQKYPKIIALQADLSLLDEVKAAVKRLQRKTNRVDVLINNAAIQYTPCFTDENFSLNNMIEEINVNVVALCSLCYLLLPQLSNQCAEHKNRAVILNVNSGLALVPKRSSAIYCATKGAVNIFSQSLQQQLQGSGVIVQQAFLPLVDTAMTKGRGSNKLKVIDASKAILRGIEKRIIEHDIGKVKLLRLLARFFPLAARRVMNKY